MTKVDYDQLEKEFVAGDLSIRALAAKHSMSFSAVADQARKREWSAKRVEFRSRKNEKVMERHATELVDAEMEIRREMITLARATLARWAEQLTSDRPPNLSAKDVAEMMKQLTLLLGGATERREEKHLGLNLTVGGPGGLDPQFLRRLLEESRRHLDRAMGDTPELGSSGASQD